MRQDTNPADSLITRIHAVKPNNVWNALAELEVIATDIRAALHGLERTQLIDVQGAFSAAFKPLGTKPAWAVNTCVVILRRLDTMPTDARTEYPDLPLSEISPRAQAGGVA